MKTHRKHAKLTLRKSGVFAPNELAFVGVKCSVIHDLVQEISHRLFAASKLAYVDASHAKEELLPKLAVYTYHNSGRAVVLSTIDKNTFNDRIRLSSFDLVCVNGNHYPANRQVVLLDPEKENSIKKRIDQLQDVQFFVKTQRNATVFDCLIEAYPAYKALPVYDLEDVSSISEHVREIVQKETPVLNGLVLAGGKSLRMGTDKSLLDYHGAAQREVAMQLLKAQDLPTYLSVRPEQKGMEGINTLSDAFVGLGPFGAICSAFMKNPNEAYLVLATDLPFVNKELIQLLLEKRNPKKIATAVKGKGKKFMEPLVTIWEPKSYPILLSYLAQGYSCPRKVLINSEVEIVEVEDELICNVNTPEEFEQVKSNLKRGEM